MLKFSIVKHYRAQVRGNLTQRKPEDTIDLPLDDKPAITEYQAVSYDRPSNSSLVDVIIRTGRKHQIRRHFAMIGFPVIGDPRYGEGNKNTAGLQLTATALEFKCPIRGEFRIFNPTRRSRK